MADERRPIRMDSAKLLGADYQLEVSAAIGRLGKQDFTTGDVIAESRLTKEQVSRSLTRLVQGGLLERTAPRGKFTKARKSVYWSLTPALLSEIEERYRTPPLVPTDVDEDAAEVDGT